MLDERILETLPEDARNVLRFFENRTEGRGQNGEPSRKTN